MYIDTMKKKKAKMGRPPIPPELRRYSQVTVAMTENELERLKNAAEREGLSISELLLRIAYCILPVAL